MSTKTKVAVNEPNRLFIAFNWAKPVFIVAYNNDLPLQAKSWADEVYNKTGNYDHDTYVVISMGEPNISNLEAFRDVFYQYAEKKLASCYFKILCDITFINEPYDRFIDIYNGKPFKALILNESSFNGDAFDEALKAYQESGLFE